MLSCLVASVVVTLIKVIGDDVNSTTIVAGRSLFGLIFLLPIMFSRDSENSQKNILICLASSQLKLHLIRGVFVAIGINLGFYSLTILPITTVTILFFTAPLFVTLMAKPVLGEDVGWRRLLAAFAGFLGAVVVINPAADILDLRLLIPVLSSVFFSVSLILHKQLSKTDPPWVLMFYMFLCTLILTLPVALSNWHPLDLQQFGIIIVIAMVATIRTYSDIRGYSKGDASFVAPFQYLRILFVGVVAYYLFNEVLLRHEWIGAGIIISSTLYIAQREYRLGSSISRPI